MNEPVLERIYRIFRQHPCIATDTRKEVKDCVFFALKGERFDANRFAEEARKRGSALTVTSRRDLAQTQGFAYVPDTLEALQQLALMHRRRMSAGIIGLTGSNGKTTTKELITAVLQTTYRTVATRGNLNNHIGVPLTLLRIRPDTQWAVVEMGSNHPGEIEMLCRLAEPDLGYITGFGEAHLEFFGDRNGVVHEKTALYRWLESHGGTALINWDDPDQRRHTAHIRRYGYTFAGWPEAQIRLDAPEDTPEASIVYKDMRIRSQLIGDFHRYNMAGALTAGLYLDIPPERIKRAIEQYRPQNNRSQIIRRGHLRIVLDAYNANPTSMLAALKSLLRMPGPHTAILGDMLELGPSAPEKHRQIVEWLSRHSVRAYLIGPVFGSVASEGGPILGLFPDTGSFIRSGAFRRLDRGTVWIKGSRGLALERILEE